jgi:predicted dehydrogenase
MMLYLGDPIEGAHIGTNYGTPWMEKEGTSDVFLKFENGAVGYYFGTWGARGTKHGYEFHAHCTEGTIVADIKKGELIGYKNENENKPELIFKVDEVSKPMDREMAHFLDCVENNKMPITNAYDSLQGLRVIWKLYEAEENKTIANLRGLGLGKAIK